MTEREEAINDFRMDELDGVMHSVDKWFDKGDPRLKLNPATRAADAREIALKAIEASQTEATRLEKRADTWREMAEKYESALERVYARRLNPGPATGVDAIYCFRQAAEALDK